MFSLPCAGETAGGNRFQISVSLLRWSPDQRPPVRHQREHKNTREWDAGENASFDIAWSPDHAQVRLLVGANSKFPFPNSREVVTQVVSQPRLNHKALPDSNSPFTMIVIGQVGVEPTRYCYRRILSPLRLPFRHCPKRFIILPFNYPL